MNCIGINCLRAFQTRLRQVASQALELRVFLDCAAKEPVSILGIGKTAVDRSMRFGRAWVYDRSRQFKNHHS